MSAPGWNFPPTTASQAMPKIGEVDQKDFQQAYSKAVSTGIPQPVKDSYGNPAYMVDARGELIVASGATSQVNRDDGNTTYVGPLGQSLPPATAQDQARTEHPQQQTNPVDDAAATKAAQDAAALARKQAQQNAVRDSGMAIWVNGQLMMPMLDGAGNVITKDGLVQYGYTAPGGKTNPSPVTDTSVWDALNLNNKSPYGLEGGWQPTNTFLLSKPGQLGVTDFGGTKLGGAFGDNPDGRVFGKDGQTLSALNAGLMNDPQQKPLAGTERGMTPQTPTGYSEYTLADFAEYMTHLAASGDPNDHSTYNWLVKQLKHAGYDSSSSTAGGKSLAEGSLSSDALIAALKAANDLSILNQAQQKENIAAGRPAGQGLTSLSEFLSQKVHDNAQAAGERWQPKVRNYTDPGDLASAARSAAMELIGRNLNPQELASFQAQFHGQETNTFNAIDQADKAQAIAAAQGESAPGAVVTAPSATGEAQAMLQGPQYAGDRSHYLAGQYMATILNELGVK